MVVPSLQGDGYGRSDLLGGVLPERTRHEAGGEGECLMARQLRMFEGKLPVAAFHATLGSFQIEDEDVDAYGADEHLVLVVTVTVDGASHKRNKDEEWERTAKLTVHGVRVAEGEMRENLLEVFGLWDPQLTIPLEMTRSSPATTGTATIGSTDVETEEEIADQETGELPPIVSFEPATTQDPALAAFLQEGAG